jgi:hypothetical protein
MGHPEDEAIRPWFYTWSLMARLFPAGSKIVAAEGGEGVRTLAGVNNGALSVMLVNDDDTARTVEVRVPGGGRRALDMYRYFDTERPVTAEGFPSVSKKVPATDLSKTLRVELPARGVVFLTTAPLAPKR